MTVVKPTNRCKGTCFLDFRNVVCEQHGADAWQKVLAAVERDLGDALQFGAVVSGGWYPLSWYKNLHAVTHEVLGVGVEFSRDVGRISTRKDLTTGIYKMFLKVVSPQFVIGNAARVFNAYYERGRMAVDEKRAGHVRATWTECVGFNKAVWEDVFGGCLGALEAGGAGNVHIRVIDGGRDECDEATVEATW